MHRPAHVLCALLVGAMLLVSACGKKAPAAQPPPPPPPATTPATPPPPPPPPPPPAPIAEKPLTEEELFARMSLAELNEKRPLADAFFDYDESELRPDARTALQKNAEWMKRWSSTRVTVEGHCDSRGTPEYNLALGERRATAVRGYLLSLGIPADRVLTVSKGKESQVCSQDAENCWSQNRRGHFVITAK